MVDVNITIQNLDTFRKALEKSPQIVGKHLDRALNLAATTFLGKTKDNIRQGVDMWKPPIDTGYMWNHIFFNIFPLKAEIYPTAEYATYVHDGTNRMRARPFFDITMNREGDNLNKIFEDELESALREIDYA